MEKFNKKINNKVDQAGGVALLVTYGKVIPKT